MNTILHANSNNHRQNIGTNHLPLHKIRANIPPTHTKHITNKQPKTTQQTTTPSTTLHCQPQLLVICALQSIQEGTAPAPFTHSTDFILAYALTRKRRQEDDNVHPYLDTFIKILNITTNDQLAIPNHSTELWITMPHHSTMIPTT